MKTVNLITFVIILAAAMLVFCPLALAIAPDRLPQEEVVQREVIPEVVANRQLPQYKSVGMRDPFQTYIIKEKTSLNSYVSSNDPTKPAVDFSAFKVQGIIWGTKIPQAIISNSVYAVGDKIQDAEIIEITKKGVTLSMPQGMVSLPAPGQGTSSNEANQPGMASGTENKPYNFN